VATVGQALGSDSLPHAQKEASLALRAGVISGLAFAVALIGGSLLLPMIYPRVGQDVLHLAFWGIVITAFVQPAKVLNSSLGTGILPSGGDTKFVLLSHVVSSYALGLPLAGLAGIALKVGPWSIFGARGLEEVLKAMMLFRRYRTASWHRKLET
jgi:Na+-driven multidrug efflux pump